MLQLFLSAEALLGVRHFAPPYVNKPKAAQSAALQRARLTLAQIAGDCFGRFFVF